MTEPAAPATAAPEAARDERPKGPPPEQLERTVAWANGLFASYYRDHPPPMPSRHGRREFGFMYLAKTFMQRHVGFRDRGELHRFLVHNAPAHCYYSTAYYQVPAAPTMREKEWLGADLIFDLDADHLKGAADMSFEEQLRAVRHQARRLVDEFLVPDFGFAAEHMHVVFSGGRGFHIHVTDPRVQSLGSAERREIVDYVSPPATVFEDLLEGMERTHAFTKDSFTKKPERDVLIPNADEPGWRGKFTRYVVRFLQEVAALDRDAAVRRLAEVKGIGPKSAAEIYEDLTPDRIARVTEGRIQSAPAVRRHLKALRGAFRDGVIRFAPGETDEPVTADVKRLIRLPGSLHGKTGLRVVPIAIDDLATFDPLADAVALPEDPVKVVVSKPEPVRLGGETIVPKPGLQELPTRHAAFLVLRRRALLPMPER